MYAPLGLSQRMSRCAHPNSQRPAQTGVQVQQAGSRLQVSQVSCARAADMRELDMSAGCMCFYLSVLLDR